MMKVSVTVNTTDLSELDLKQMSQLGVDCIDFGAGNSFAGVKEQGYPDLDKLLELQRKIRSYGMDINRVTLPNLSDNFMRNRPGSERELENSINAVKTFGEANIGPLGLGGNTSVLATFMKVGPQRASGIRVVCLRPACCFEPRIATVEL